MGTRKKGSELVFNLQWRNMPDNGGDRSSVVGMYDSPATTLNFETFKSYLLKNSGVVGNDVKVTYFTDNGAEWVIDSQEWFEIALCAFRLKARLGEVIFLKLDKIRTPIHTPRKDSNDVETQFDNESIGINPNTPPDWFLGYMKQFKRDLVEEITYVVSSNLGVNGREREKENVVAAVPQFLLPPRKMKPETSKRSRKHVILGETPIDKDLLKTLKFDRKLEIKLDKLDAKTKKIKEKKQALMNKLEGEEHHLNSKRSQIPIDLDGTPLMNASLVSESAVIPRMMGGETYLHTWDVINNGKLSWTTMTELRLTWGSAEMKPSSNVIRCPPLQPGQRGTICVRFQIPQRPGTYESYWNFYDRDIRFGHWLSCCVIVDAPINYHNEKFLSKKAKIDLPIFSPENYGSQPHVEETREKKFNSPEQYVSQEKIVFATYGDSEPEVVPDSVIDLSRKIQGMKIRGTSQVDSDSDWESVWSYSGGRKQRTTNDKIVTDNEPPKCNKYGINEKDLIVDLSVVQENVPLSPKQNSTVNSVSDKADDKSQNSRQSLTAAKEVITDKTKEETVEPNKNTNDDNNNNGTSVNNNSSEESICEIGSEASDLSSGYDVISGPVCEEKEDKGYVFITIDGNKLPVPKYILRPDFLENAEAAPGPLNTDDENSSVAKDQREETVPQESTVNAANLESQIQELEQDIQDTKSFMSHCSAAGTCFSDVNPGVSSGSTRLFIFPQNSPGYEYVLNLTSEKEEETVSNPMNKIEAISTEPMQSYTWTHSDTQYTFADVQNACSNMNNAQLRYDPYGPLDQSRCSSSQSNANRQGQIFQHIPNYQQSTPKTCTPQFKQETPSAPPQPTPSSIPRSPNPPVQTVPPVHILPENLVSGAVNVASSAINTARSVINMIVPPKSEPGRWINGHWVTENMESTRAKNLCILADMGFWDTDLNATLLARYNDDVSKVVSELLQQ